MHPLSWLICAFKLLIKLGDQRKGGIIVTQSVTILMLASGCVLFYLGHAIITKVLSSIICCERYVFSTIIAITHPLHLVANVTA
jgi:hypothetical protein